MLRYLFAAMFAIALLTLSCGVRAEDLGHIRAQALDLLNQSRKEHDLPPLTLEAKLNQAAQGHAEDMLKRKYFAHESPEGKTVGDRYKQAGGSKWLVTAENISTFTNTPPPITDNILKHLQEGWMNSPGHRKNILLRGITEFGYGIAVDKQGNLYAVQNFAGPGTDGDAASGEAKAIGPEEQITLMLAAVNAERKKAGRRPLGANDALAKGAIALLPEKAEDDLSFEKKNVFNLIPAVDGQSWSSIGVAGVSCGGCGTKAVEADIAMFANLWMKNKKNRTALLNAKATHLGFTIHASGKGKKTAIVVVGERKGR